MSAAQTARRIRTAFRQVSALGLAVGAVSYAILVTDIRSGFFAEATWLGAFDRRVPLLTDTSALDLRDFGAESREEEQYRVLAPHVKQEEEGKFRCKECNKLFSARKFVEKHLGLKHPELLGTRLDEVSFLAQPCALPCSCC